MDHGYRLKARAEQLNLRQTSELVVGVEDVAEHVAQEFGCSGISIQGQSSRLMRKTQRAEIVNSKNVVGVGVCVEDGIHRGDLFAQRLLAKVGRSVNQDVMPVE